jgi:hypothetical protein
MTMSRLVNMDSFPRSLWAGAGPCTGWSGARADGDVS